MEISYR